MSDTFNQQLLSSFDAADFAHNRPCPWFCFSGLLTQAAFETLHAEFPPLGLFEKHQGMSRLNGQRPHNRYYLAFEKSIYHDNRAGTPGCARLSDLSPRWQQFIDELQSNDAYLAFVQRLLAIDQMQIRFAWHVAGTGDDVSPHCDTTTKAGTQIFYFNSSADWEKQWGGGTVFLRGKKNGEPNPEVTDFEGKVTCRIVDNRCLLFKNTPDAWHGVEPLRCPPDRYRRVFNVIFIHPQTARPQPKRFHLWSRLKRGVGRGPWTNH